MPSEHQVAQGSLSLCQPKVDELHQVISFCVRELAKDFGDVSIECAFQASHQRAQCLCLSMTNGRQTTVCVHRSCAIRT